MRELDGVEVIVEKEKYAKEGVHKGMRGTILDPRNIDGCWLVYFSDPVTHADTIGIPIKEVDLKVVEPYVDHPIVQLIADKDSYLQQGVHKGMYGELWRQNENQALIWTENQVLIWINNKDFIIVEENTDDYKTIRDRIDKSHICSVQKHVVFKS